MALGMRSWFGSVAAGFALMTLWQLPPSAIATTERLERSPEEAAYLEASGELNAAYAALQRLRWADSLGALVVRSSRSHAPLVFAPEGVDEERLTVIRRALAETTTSAVPNGDRVVLAWVLQPLGHGLDPEVRTDQRGRTETYVGSVADVHYCMRVVVTEQPKRAVDDQARRLESGSGLASGWGACGVFADHGRAGRDVLRWLERGAANFALIDVPLARRGDAPRLPRKRLFGRSWASMDLPVSTVLERCITADEATCASIFSNPITVRSGSEADAQATARSPALSVSDRFGQVGGVPFPFLLADLEADFGAEAFGRFWRSNAPVEVAFRNAFGVAPGAWMVSWVDRIYGIDSAGPRLAGSRTTLPLALTFGLFAAVSMLLNRRRRVA